ncbi:MAG: AAA family ATPase [Ardenticatenales bacterium]|nr:AAA family ATPase [Ardenticatenales bacterium]
MSKKQQVAIRLLSTGVPGLDEVLGGGLPEYSFNFIAGTPGAGKTTLIHQIMFTLATPKHPALYFTVMGEPPLKILRHQQQMDFFESSMVGDSIHFIDLSEIVLEQGLGAALARIVQQVEERNPALVIVDSFQAIVRAATLKDHELDLQSFIQRLAIHLTNWQATTFLVGEPLSNNAQNSPLRTVADSIIELSQNIHRNSVVRKLQVVKVRGQAPMPGLHTFRISGAGLQIFPRIPATATQKHRARPHNRMATGVAGLDDLIGGGFPGGDAVIVSGPTGAGKSLLATQFIAAGAAVGETGVIAVFEEHPEEYVRRASELGIDLAEMERQNMLKVIYIRPLDLSPDETLHEIQAAVALIGARRVVIDSMTGFELALAPTFREDFRESLYRMVVALTGTGVTVLLTMEIQQSYTDLRISAYLISFLADTIILLRYAEVAGELRRNLSVIKMRNSAHSKGFTLYEITAQGMVVRHTLEMQPGSGIGSSATRERSRQPIYPGLTEEETVLLQALIKLGKAPLEGLAQRVGLPDGPLLRTALDRLVSLSYAIRLHDEVGTLYQPMAQLME